jgi:hypothetical protein
LQIYEEMLNKYPNEDGNEYSAAMEAAIGFLVSQGIREGSARANFDKLLKKTAWETSFDLRSAGYKYEQVEDWEEAAECYDQAAKLLTDFEPQDAAMLRARAEECRVKLGGGGS